MPDYADTMTDAVNSPTKVAKVCERVHELKALNHSQWIERARVRDIMNNRKAMAALVGKTIRDPDARLPIANMMLRSNQVLGQKLGRRPDVKKDPPVSTDSDRAHKKADKQARIIESLDRASEMELLLPQVGRWLPGYGFVAGVIRQGKDRNGDPFPNVEIRDPYQTFPAEWGPGQQPCDIAFVYTMTKAALAEKYGTAAAYKQQGNGGAVLLGQAGWSNQGGGGVEVYEYYNQEGCWWVVPETNTLLSFVPNLLSRPQFRVVKRFCFDELNGVGDHAIGIMANMVRLALLQVIAAEDTVMAPLNVSGDLRSGTYRKGRNEINYFTPGSTWQRDLGHIPFEAFQMFDRYEKQLRLITGHSQQDDAISPNSFVTGQGLQELGSQSSTDVREYFTSIDHWMMDLDALRFEWLEKYYGDSELNMFGVAQGAPFAETYIPNKDIHGDYVTRRVHGAMAGFDDATKIVTGLQLVQGEVIDVDTFREQIDGLENHQKIKERILADKAESIFMNSLAARAEQGDPLATDAAIQLLPAGQMREIAEKVFAPPEQAPAAVPVGPPTGGGPPPDVQAVLARLTSGGDASASVSTTGSLAA